jgi:hypothetical protein
MGEGHIVFGAFGWHAITNDSNVLKFSALAWATTGILSGMII